MSDSISRSAIRSAAVAAITLGALSLALGLIATLPLAISIFIGHTQSGPGHLVYFSATAVSFLLPAALYFSVAIFVRKRKPWAAILGITVGTVHAIAGVLVLGGAIYAVHRIGPYLVIPIGAAIVLIVLSVWGITACWRALEHINELPDEQAAFTPMLRSGKL